MTESPLSPYIKTATEYLQAARARLGREQAQHLVGYGIGLLGQLLAEIRTELEGYEMAELASVYDTLAAQVAHLLDLDAPAAFLALVELCDDENARRLAHGQPAPTRAQLQLLRSRLAWITVTYEARPGKPAKRISEIVYKNPSGQPRSGTATLEFGYEDLPERVRDRMFARGQQAVRFQLYPAAA